MLQQALFIKGFVKVFIIFSESVDENNGTKLFWQQKYFTKVYVW